jgi:hypothetical protein
MSALDKLDDGSMDPWTMGGVGCGGGLQSVWEPQPPSTMLGRLSGVGWFGDKLPSHLEGRHIAVLVAVCGEELVFGGSSCH